MRWFVLLVFGAIGLAALGMGVQWGIDEFLHKESARGRVVENYEDRSDAWAVSFYPVVEFSAPGAGPIRFRSVLRSTGSPQYELGAEVGVLYDPRDTARARIGGFGEIGTGPAAISAFGGVILFLSIQLFLKIGRFEKDLEAFGSGTPGRIDE